MIAALLRKLAEHLRKQAGTQKLPAPIPNPVASRVTGDMGSITPPKPKNSTSVVPAAGGTK